MVPRLPPGCQRLGFLFFRTLIPPPPLGILRTDDPARAARGAGPILETEERAMLNSSRVYGNQHICCNVESCVYNDAKNCHCTLESITVQPNCNCNTGKADGECCCGDYRCKC